MTKQSWKRSVRNRLGALEKRMCELEELATAGPGRARGDSLARSSHDGGRLDSKRLAQNLETFRLQTFVDGGDLEPALVTEWSLSDMAVLDASSLSDLLSALASTHRITLLREMTAGERTSGDLVSALGEERSAGQVYHHLKELQSAGWVEQVRRGMYRIPPARVVPLLVILAAAGSGLAD